MSSSTVCPLMLSACSLRPYVHWVSDVTALLWCRLINYFRCELPFCGHHDGAEGHKWLSAMPYTIEFTFDNAVAPPARPSSPMGSIDSLEYIDSTPSSSTSTSAQSTVVVPAAAATPNIVPAIGPPGLTVAATLRWYAITVGTRVGVFQGW